MIDEKKFEPADPQQNYRKNQAKKGLVRYELQIPYEVKEKIEEIYSKVVYG